MLKKSKVKKPVTQSILVVDDDKKLASSFKLILEGEGYNVDIAHKWRARTAWGA